VKVLIIEDDRSAASLVKDLLESLDFNVAVSYTGGEGRERIKRELPDLLVLDLSLPNDLSLDICRDVKADHPGMLVFILTVLGNSKDIMAGLEAGADDYLPKPFDQSEFLTRIQRMIERAKRNKVH